MGYESCGLSVFDRRSAPVAGLPDLINDLTILCFPMYNQLKFIGVDPFMFNIGMQELLLIAAVALLVVGPKRLPDVAKSLGKGLAEFRKTAEGVTDSLKGTLQDDEPQSPQKEGEKGEDKAAEEKKLEGTASNG
ncbi:Sec-independent protein translocase protein TatB [Syntrophus buswellii]|jgi:Tat protein translocase TatB subunit|uniref:Sec-independent protein translocase protein TatB n=1 Tax=Syntrophus TaxID=43773 RepID=UPI00345F0F83